MTNAEREEFCLFAAALLAPPDRALVLDLEQEGLYARLNAQVRTWGGAEGIVSALRTRRKGGRLLPVLRKEYRRLFGPHGGAAISLVESTYKPWSTDTGCGMVFAAAPGLLMGDAAVHLLGIYERLSIEVPEEYRSMPDHLVLELEFLALLCRDGQQELINGFIAHHLDWIPELRKELARAGSCSFYRSAVELLHLFIRNEMAAGKVVDRGEKRIH